MRTAALLSLFLVVQVAACSTDDKADSTDTGELIGFVRETIETTVGMDYAWPGNVRELEQCVRRILVTGRYEGRCAKTTPGLAGKIAEGVDNGIYEAQDLLADYCRLLYQRYGTYEDVARRTGLDRRTVKKHILRTND